MSDMTVLFKDEIKKYDTDIHQDFNEIVTKKDYEDDDLFGIYPTEHIPKQGKFKFLKKEEGEESFVKNYGNPLASTFMVKRTLVIEENESKIALKIYTYVSSRDVGKKYFKVRRVIDYLTFNFKRKLFYSGTLNLKKKKKIGAVMCINKTDINSIEVVRKIENFEKNENQNEYPIVSEKKLTKKCLNIFLDRIIERLNLNIDSDSDNIRKKYYQLFLEISGVKYPNAFEKFASYYTPKKEIKNFGNNIVTWFMKKHELKGTKIRNLLNKYENIEIDSILQCYKVFGIDLFNKINDNSLLTDKKQSIYVNGYYLNDDIVGDLSRNEKENFISIINTCTVYEFLNSFSDHIMFKEQLKKYGEYVKVTATTYDEYVMEHSEWSSLLQSYKTGDVTRNYGEDAYLIQKEIYSEGITYYPVLLTTTGEYEMESSHQHNCVRTYSEKAQSLIISLRKDSVNGNERATVEFQFRRNQLVIVQKLGKFNKGLTNEWITPINELNEFANYLYSKEIIKLPTMVKKYRNGKTVSSTAHFDDKNEKTFNLVPTWDVETNDNHLQYYMDDYNLFEDLNFIDELP